MIIIDIVKKEYNKISKILFNIIQHIEYGNYRTYYIIK